MPMNNHETLCASKAYKQPTTWVPLPCVPLLGTPGSTLALKRRSGAENQRNGRPEITTPGMAGTCPPAAMPMEKNRPNERAVANEETS